MKADYVDFWWVFLCDGVGGGIDGWMTEDGILFDSILSVGDLMTVRDDIT